MLAVKDHQPQKGTRGCIEVKSKSDGYGREGRMSTICGKMRSVRLCDCVYSLMLLLLMLLIRNNRLPWTRPVPWMLPEKHG
jgi:hypothetical protein